MFAQHRLTTQSASEHANEQGEKSAVIHNRGIKINGICSHEKSGGMCHMRRVCALCDVRF